MFAVVVLVQWLSKVVVMARIGAHVRMKHGNNGFTSMIYVMDVVIQLLVVAHEVDVQKC